MSRMKLAFYLLMILAVSKVSIGSDLITESCRDASKGNPNINFDFCVASLKAKSSSPPTSLEKLVAMSIQITMSSGAKIVSTISNLLKDPKFSDNAKKFLKDCSAGYSDSLSDLDEAIESLKSKDVNSANIKVSAAMDASVDCEDEFKEGNEKSPSTEGNKIYVDLNAISLAFINMLK